jgi:hypothetical protein
MAVSRLLCPVCSGLLGHMSDLDSEWDKCYSCGRQYNERSLPRYMSIVSWAPRERLVPRSGGRRRKGGQR